MSHPYIVTECYADRIFIEFLGFKPISRHSGIGDVVNTVLKKNNRLGLIDKDKNKLKGQFKKNFQLVRENTELKIELFNYNDKYIIRISPEIEDWLWSEAEKLGVRQISNSLEDFKKLTKNEKIEINPGLKSKFKNYLNALKQKDSQKLNILKQYLDDAIRN